jgi:hypothetical protein
MFPAAQSWREAPLEPSFSQSVAPERGTRCKSVMRACRMQDVMAVTPEAAGSSPVDPANYPPVSYLHCSVDCLDLRRVAEG